MSAGNLWSNAVKIKVTQDCIDKGVQGSCSKCPIALAILKERPNSTVVVGDCYTSVDDERFCMPEEASEFIHDFDEGIISLKPFEFELID